MSVLIILAEQKNRKYLTCLNEIYGNQNVGRKALQKLRAQHLRKDSFNTKILWLPVTCVVIVGGMYYFIWLVWNYISVILTSFSTALSFLFSLC